MAVVRKCSRRPRDRGRVRCSSGRTKAELLRRRLRRDHLPMVRSVLLRYTAVDSFVHSCCHGEEFSIDVLCDLEGRALNALLRTTSSEARRVDHGSWPSGIGLDRDRRFVAESLLLNGPGALQCLRRRRHAPRDRHRPPLWRRLPAAGRGRQPLPEHCLELAHGRRPEPRLGDFG
jgi:hypothetical protein